MKKIIGLGKKTKKVGGLNAKKRYGMVDGSLNFNGFGILRRNGNYLPNALIVGELSQFKKLILLLKHLMVVRN